MKSVQIILLIVAGLLLGACGKDEANEAAKTSAPAPAAAKPAADKAAMGDAKSTMVEAIEGMPSGGTRYIDHAKDEIEFGLKKSLAGLESLLEDVSDSEQVAMIKKEIAALKSKLDAL